MSHTHEEIITFDVAPIGKHNIILGLPWCTYHEVQFDWNQHNITKWSPSCEGRCFYAPTVTPLLVQLMSPDASIPVRASTGAIGYDLMSTETLIIPPSTRSPITTRIAIQLPEGTYGRIAPRSGLAVKHSLNIAAGVIDPDYRGELRVVLINNGQFPYTVTKGECIAQLILENATLEDVIVTEFLTDMAHGQHGFRSTRMNKEIPPMVEDLVEIYAITLGHSAHKKIPPIEQ
jgi:dUTP pyrophosphatase